MTAPVAPPAAWRDVRSRYLRLKRQRLDRRTLDSWLREWSRLSEEVREAGVAAQFAYDRQLDNPEREVVWDRFATEIWPRAEQLDADLGGRLLEVAPDHPGLQTMIRRLEHRRGETGPDFARLVRRERALVSRYQRITADMAVSWRGQRVPPVRLTPELRDSDPSVREAAFRLLYAPYIEQHPALTRVFDELLGVRQEIAGEAGFANYRDFVHHDSDRLDYSPDDCRRWALAIESAVVPALSRLRSRQRSCMGLPRLRPWDLEHEPDGGPSAQPFASPDDLVDKAIRLFDLLDPHLGAHFRSMARDGLLDLGSRPGKAAGGGYCAELPVSRRAVILLNAAGVPADVVRLAHEAGHAFHFFETFAIEPCFQRRPGNEMCELAAMAVELLSSRRWADAGFYTEPQARRALSDHLRGAVTLLANIALGDAFQQWLYTDPAAADARRRDEMWIELRQRFDPEVDWWGLEPWLIARWYAQPHFFVAPFYYIEYGLAQFGALQVYRRSLSDERGALRDYRTALALGATRPLPELYEAAGAALVFDAGAMEHLVRFLVAEMETLVSHSAGESMR